MKKWLSLLCAITLIGASTTSLVACNTPQYSEEELTKLKAENKINTVNQQIKDNLEWIAPQEQPFNKVDNKYYFVVCRINKIDNWEIFKFQNKEIKPGYIMKTSNPKINMSYWLASNYYTIGINKDDDWSTFQGWIKENKNFNSVYCWNQLDKPEPDLVIDDKGILKVKGE
ncbi:putative lipoprotein [Spiroplasma kunkelii CR2-3x]|uniref:Putative lipoprotein n=1 Tax=Spiroplasma kunkelii CR2-3x TaxID=273035 RepID=A0A0K2JHF0_SPIKU|nr:hypothetical protein [Spiroplasma kunkelii]ALA98025.1 putative lipoprotein [Spiroplasma kunkelii CR2-3x]